MAAIGQYQREESAEIQFGAKRRSQLHIRPRDDPGSETAGESRRLHEPSGRSLDGADRSLTSFQGGDAIGGQSGVREQAGTEARKRRDGLHDVENGI
jgi:hypothetical protein